jgi:hypothetical protein
MAAILYLTNGADASSAAPLTDGRRLEMPINCPEQPAVPIGDKIGA